MEGSNVENSHFALYALRVANRPSTPASKIHDFLGCSTISGGPGLPFPADLWGSWGLGRNTKTCLSSFQKSATKSKPDFQRACPACTRRPGPLWSFTKAFVKGIPKCCLGHVFFGCLGYQGQNTHFQEHNGLLALPPTAARTSNHYFPEHVWFLALAPKASSKTLCQQTTSGCL